MTTETRNDTTAVTAPFELSTRYASESARVSITDPESGGDTGMWVEIEPMFSAHARQAVTRSRRPTADANETADDVDLYLEQIIAVTRAWGGFVVDGVTPTCTPESVRALYTNPRTAWIAMQVQLAFLSLNRFFTTAKAA